MTIIINLTPHEINIIDLEPIPSSGSVRVTESSHIVDTVNGIDIIVKKYGIVEGIPDPVEDVMFVVSAMVAQQLTHRDDILMIGDTIRNEKGQIIGAKNFAKLPQTYGKLED